VNDKYTRLDGETDEELIYRICADKDIIGTWDDVAEILNELLGTDFGESTFRKKYSAFVKMFDANREKFSTQTGQLDEINERIRTLQKERAKLQSEKIEYNRYLREDARDELIMEHICDAITALPSLDRPKIIEPSDVDEEYVLIFGDEHFGTEFEIRGLTGEIINAYSPDIFVKRMETLLTKTRRLIDKNNIKTLRVFSMGDFSDGCLRVSQLRKLRYGVVDGTVWYANYISEWLNELTKYTRVVYQMTDGNHTELRQLNQPKGTFVEDNMGKVVREFIKIRLKDNPNFEFIENPTGYIFDYIFGFAVLGIHGEVKNMEDSLREFSVVYDTPINYLISGHMHHSRMEEIGINTEVIGVPSIIGADPYSMTLRKISSPAAKLLTFAANDGKVCEYTLKL